jgi:hypothetical protein
MVIPQEDRLKGMNEYKEKSIYIVMFEEGYFLKERIQKLLASFMEPMYLIDTYFYINYRFEIKYHEIQRELDTAIR